MIQNKLIKEGNNNIKLHKQLGKKLFNRAW